MSIEAAIKRLTEDASNYIKNPTLDNRLEMLFARERLLLMTVGGFRR
jgi:hypothetical protein